MKKGETYVGSILILLILFVIFAALITQNVRVRPSPIVDEAFWLIEDQKVTTAPVRSRVEAHVVIRATGEYVGSAVVKVRKDIALWLDEDYAIMTAPMSLRGDEKKEIELDFIPDEASIDNLRGYFIEVNFLVTKAKWVMENSYPPRLRVMGSGTRKHLSLHSACTIGSYNRTNSVLICFKEIMDLVFWKPSFPEITSLKNL